jgi:hypothetical protein
VSLATVYYRLKRKADGDREKAIVAKLQTGVQGAAVQGAAVQGAGVQGAEPVKPQSQER